MFVGKDSPSENLTSARETEINKVLERFKGFMDTHNESVFILRAAAGKGAEEVLGKMVEYVKPDLRHSSLILKPVLRRNCLILTPSLIAAKGLNRALGILGKKPEAASIYRSIYRVIPIFAPKVYAKLKENDEGLICFIYEASMLSSVKDAHELRKYESGATGHLLTDLILYIAPKRLDSKLVFIGDPCKLLPPDSNTHPALESTFFLQKEIDLKVVVAELDIPPSEIEKSLILKNASQIGNLLGKPNEERSRIVIEFGDDVVDLNPDNVVDSYIECFRKDPFNLGVVVCRSNEKCFEYTLAIRTKCFEETRTLQKGDRLLVVRNQYRGPLASGDFILVEEIGSLEQHQVEVRVSKEDAGSCPLPPLQFRRIVYRRTPDYPPEEAFIHENLLTNNRNQLTARERKALFIDFEERHPELQEARTLLEEAMTLLEGAITLLEEASEISSSDKSKREELERKVLRFRSDVLRFRGNISRLESSLREALEEDLFYNALEVNYGYAMTCHRAQAQKWDTVFVDYSNQTQPDDDNLRWIYTATTRAKKKIYAINPPRPLKQEKIHFMPIVEMKEVPVEKFSGKLDPNLSFPFHPSGTRKELLLKFQQVNEALNGEPFKIQSVDSLQYRERYTFTRKGEETWQTKMDFIYNGKYAFKSPTPTLKAQDDNTTALLALLGKAPTSPKEVKLSYHPSLPVLADLYDFVSKSSEGLGIRILNVEEFASQFYVIYYFQMEGDYCATVKFFFNKEGIISPTAYPQSQKGKKDLKLEQLLEEINKAIG